MYANMNPICEMEDKTRNTLDSSITFRVSSEIPQKNLNGMKANFTQHCSLSSRFELQAPIRIKTAAKVIKNLDTHIINLLLMNVAALQPNRISLEQSSTE